MVIRPAEKKDVTKLSELFRQEIEFAHWQSSYYELSGNFDWHAYAEEKLNDRSGCILIAEDKGTLTGFIYVRIMRYPQKGTHKSFLQRVRKKPGASTLSPIKPLRWGIIEGCYVLPAYRRLGIGSGLVEKAREWFKGQGINRIELSMVSSNETADYFWRNAGFDHFRSLLFKRI